MHTCKHPFSHILHGLPIILRIEIRAMLHGAGHDGPPSRDVAQVCASAECVDATKLAQVCGCPAQTHDTDMIAHLMELASNLQSTGKMKMREVEEQINSVLVYR